jgi:2'-5' RNA ligase
LLAGSLNNVQVEAVSLVAIGLELPPEIAGEFAAFRACYDPGYSADLANGGAHITLKRPDLAIQPLEKLAARLQKIIQNFPAPQIRVSGLTIYHSPGESAIYLRVLPTEQLSRLHRELHEGLQGYLAMQANFEGDFFIAHVTLANWLSDRQLAQAIHDLERQGLLNFQRRFCCHELSLAVRLSAPPASYWQRQNTFWLKDFQ